MMMKGETWRKRKPKRVLQIEDNPLSSPCHIQYSSFDWDNFRRLTCFIWEYCCNAAQKMCGRVYRGTLLQDAPSKSWYILCTWVKRWDQKLQSLGLLPQMVLFRAKFARDKRIESSIENNRIAPHSSGSAVFPRLARGSTTAVKTVKRKHKNKNRPLIYGNLLNPKLTRKAESRAMLLYAVPLQQLLCNMPLMSLPAPSNCTTCRWLPTLIKHTALHVDNVDHGRPTILLLILSLHVLLHNLPSLEGEARWQRRGQHKMRRPFQIETYRNLMPSLSWQAVSWVPDRTWLHQQQSHAKTQWCTVLTPFSIELICHRRWAWP